MAAPRVSVVVPFYNNAETLADCLQSIAAQTMTDLEVFMVDDGSTDASAEIAQAQAAADPRFTLVQVPHGGGPGYTRNRGIERARGEFLAFVDSDDMIPPNAYEILLHTLESSGSDMVSGNVLRMGQDGFKQSGLHAQAVKGRRTGTHITKTPSLLYESRCGTSCSGRSSGTPQPALLPRGRGLGRPATHDPGSLLATSVNTVPDVVYYWRQRAAGRAVHHPEPHRHLQPAGPHHRVQQHRRLPGRTGPRQAAAAAPAQGTGQRPVDVRQRPLQGHRRLPARVRRPGQRLPDAGRRRVYRTLPATHKLAYYLVGPGMLTRLLSWSLALIRPVDDPGGALGRLRADLPWRTDRTAPSPGKSGLLAGPGIRSSRWKASAGGQGGTWSSPAAPTCHPSTSASAGTPPRSSYCCHGPDSVPHPDPGHLVPAPAGDGCVPARSATATSGPDCGPRSGSRRFRIGGRWLAGDWDAFILVRGHGVWRPARVHTPVRGAASGPVSCRGPAAGAARMGRRAPARSRCRRPAPGWPEFELNSLKPRDRRRMRPDQLEPGTAAAARPPAGRAGAGPRGRRPPSRSFPVERVQSGGSAARLRAAVPVASLPVRADPPDSGRTAGDELGGQPGRHRLGRSPQGGGRRAIAGGVPSRDGRGHLSARFTGPGQPRRCRCARPPRW